MTKVSSFSDDVQKYTTFQNWSNPSGVVLESETSYLSRCDVPLIWRSCSPQANGFHDSGASCMGAQCQVWALETCVLRLDLFLTK